MKRTDEKPTDQEIENAAIVIAMMILTPILAKHIGQTLKDALLLRFIAMTIEGGVIGIEKIRKGLTLNDIFEQVRIEQQMSLEFQKKELANA